MATCKYCGAEYVKDNTWPRLVCKECHYKRIYSSREAKKEPKAVSSIVTCRTCPSRYEKNKKWHYNICRDCYRKKERERKRKKGPGGYIRCDTCNIDLTKENKAYNKLRCITCDNDIKEQNRRARELAEQHSKAMTIKRHEECPEPMGIPIYNPRW